MFGAHLPELIILLLIILVFFGAKRLPDLGSGVGKGIVEFRKSVRELSQEDEPGLTGGTPSGRSATTVQNDGEKAHS